MFDANIPSSLWVDSILTATYLINQLPSPTTKNKSPYQLLNHRKPTYNHLRTFGCACYPLLPPPSRNKLQPRTLQCVFIGYHPDAKGYKCLHIPTGRVYLTRHITFNESHFSFTESSPNPPSNTSQSTASTSLSPFLLTPSYPLSHSSPNQLHRHSYPIILQLNYLNPPLQHSQLKPKQYHLHQTLSLSLPTFPLIQ